MDVPVIEQCDVLVFGAPSATVAAALAAKEGGRRVVAVSDKSYFGEETAGALRLWPEETSGDPLFQRVFSPERQSNPPPPVQVKHALETALLEADIPFYLQCRPVLLLRNEEGDIAGVVFAYRTSLYAVRSRVIVDASSTGVLARLAQIPLTAVTTYDSRDLVVVGNEPSAGAPFQWEEAGPPFMLQEGQERGKMQAYRLRVPLKGMERVLQAWQGGGHHPEWAADLAADQWGRTQAHYAGMLYSADTWLTPWREYAVGEAVIDGGTGNTNIAHDLATVPEGALSYADGRLFLANGLLPLSDDARQHVYELGGQLALGRLVGSVAARYAPHVPDVTGDLIADGGGSGPSGTVRFAPSFLRPNDGGVMGQLHIESLPDLGELDVVVAGGGTAGAPAGIAAARAGAKTVVLESLHGFGGVGTLGLIAKYWYGHRVGFTSEVDAGVGALSGEADARKLDRWNPEHKMNWFLRALGEAGGSAWFHSFAFGVQMEGSSVAGVLVSTPFGSGLLRTRSAIDATGNADLAAAAGAPCRVIEADHVAVQGTGLSPRRPGKHYRNSDHTFIDDTDMVGASHAFVVARAKFKDDFDVAPIVGSRERRQIVGEWELSPLDFLTQRTYADTIHVGESNFDSHGFTIHPVFTVFPPDREALRAYVPYRCLLPQGVDGLLVTGLGMSAHRDVLPVVRMQPDVQNQGFAAGLAAATAAEARVSVRHIDVRQLQARLVDEGILSKDVLSHEESPPLSDDHVVAVARQGAVDLYSTAVILGHRRVTEPVLLEHMREADDADKQEDAALMLGLWGNGAALPSLIEMVKSRPWDDGWHYTGMGQFGKSMSRLDALIIALGRAAASLRVAGQDGLGDGNFESAPVTQARDIIIRKIRELDADSPFSHHRAVSIAAGCLAHPDLAAALADLLQKPGMQGHVHRRTTDVLAQVNDSLTETEARNASLKELLVARGLYLCGDKDGLGQGILKAYTQDLRGHYARHAQALLGSPKLDELRLNVL